MNTLIDGLIDQCLLSVLSCVLLFRYSSLQSRLVITLVLSPISIVFAIVVFCKMGALQFDALGGNPTILSE